MFSFEKVIKGHVSNLLGSPASGESQQNPVVAGIEEVSNLLGSPASGEGMSIN